MVLVKFFRYFVAMVTFLAISGTTAVSQSPNEKLILVLDASGSMWGQIDGVNKIVIAKQAVNDLLDTLPESQEIGLSAYGHREKGSCADIELLVPPAANSHSAIRAAVDAINPKGKTPLSAAVIAAARELRFEEDPATVILISDGRETCDLDPCAVGAELEATGIGFTAHVIGFDVTGAEDRAQLACLAEETGGRFLSASNATELVAALEEVVVETAPAPPAQSDILLEATDGPDGPVIGNGLVWWLEPEAGDGTRLENFEIGAVRMTAKPGRYSVRVARPATADTAERVVEIVAGGDNHVVLALGAGRPEATISAPATAVAGSTILVTWDGPDAENDQLVVGDPKLNEGLYINFAFTRDGAPAQLQMPPRPGTFEIRYILASDSRRILARVPIEVTPVAASVSGPATADVASEILVDWEGPAYESDLVTIARPDVDGGYHESYGLTRDGSPVTLTMPSEPGTYELRYVMAQDRTVIATQPIEVTAVSATVEGPAVAAMGSEVLVGWTGPAAQNDYISVARPGEPGNRYENYTYVREGSPLKLRMPSEAGGYEIRYVLGQDHVILATQTVTVEPVAASLEAPEAAEIGAEVLVTWDGPDAQNDYISVARTDADGNRYENYTYTREGSPLTLTMPSEPGGYEIRYVLNQDHRVLARKSVTVEDAVVTLEAPATAGVGATIVVGWVGPNARNDYISVARLDADGNRYENYTYTREGTPLKLRMPSEPGDYEIRYVLNQDNRILARAPVTVEAVQVFLDTPSRASVGSTVVVDWVGPDAQNDYISVARPGDPGNGYENYTYTREGTPLKLRMPAEPGEYEIRYVLNQDNTVLERVAVTVEEAEVSVSAPSSAEAGSSVVVDWVGPDAQNDYISVAAVGAAGNGYETYTYTREGSPLRLKMPAEPGEYEIRYVLNQGNTVLAAQAVTVTAVAGSVSVPSEAAAGSDVVVTWEGPGYERDYLTVVPVGAGPGEYRDYAYVSEGSPLTLKMPIEAGDYEIRYVLDQGPKVLARAPIRLTAVTARLSAPAEAAAGSNVLVQWEGPGYQRDFITVVAVGEPDGAYRDYEYTPAGNPVTLTMPDAPGSYEIRYVVEGENKVLARVPITLK